MKLYDRAGPPTGFALPTHRRLAVFLCACLALLVGAGWTAAPAAHASEPEPSTTEAPEDPNGAGDEDPSGATDAPTNDAPRAAARFVVVDQPPARVVYGTSSKVMATLVMEGDVGVPLQTVELLAKIRPSTQWRRVASSLTDTQGGVTLRATLPASAALRLHHPSSIVAAPDLAIRSVVVAKRVTVAAGRARTRVGMPVVVRGRVAPAQPVRSSVLLQRQVSGSWRKVASGRMITGARYMIRWIPKRAGSYRLRVVKPSDAMRAAGTSSVWRHRVDPETAADVARDIRRNKRITLAKVHVSGGGYLGSPHENIVDISNGLPARHSCHGGAPCSSTRVNLRLLQAIRDMGTRGALTVSEIAGGVHTGGSAHYSGNGLDITWVNGRHVGAGASYGMVVDRCGAYGASVIASPSNDPYGSHHDHVHCAWG